MDKTFIGCLEESFRKYSGETALIYLGKKISYSELKELVNRFAAALEHLGIKETDRVMIYLPNTPQLVIAYLAILEIGAVAVPVSPIYTPNEIFYMSNDCRAETIICQDTNFGYVKEVMDKGSLKRAIVTNIADMVPRWKRFVGRLFDKIPHGNVSKGSGIYHFMDLLRYPARPTRRRGEFPREQQAYIIYTGGTTGLPKGVQGTHHSLYCGLIEWSEVLKGSVIANGHLSIILQLPLFHIFGISIFFGFGLCEGNASILIPLPQVDGILECIQRYKANLFFGVPTLYRMILENDRLDQYDLRSLLYCWSGGDVLPNEVFLRWKKHFNKPIHQIYGATETSNLAITDIEKEPCFKSVGRPITVAGKRFALVDPDTLIPVKPGESGELLVTAPWLAKHYLNKPGETAESFVNIEGEVYYRTKDIFEIKNGELYFVDRSADVIKHKGFRVSASEIEAVLQDHPAVIGACVVGAPDDRVGERIKAFVVLKGDVRGVRANDLIKWCRDRLSVYKVPQYIEFRDMLPKSKVGKLLRREIRDEERIKIAEQGSKRN